MKSPPTTHQLREKEKNEFASRAKTTGIEGQSRLQNLKKPKEAKEEVEVKVKGSKFATGQLSRGHGNIALRFPNELKEQSVVAGGRVRTFHFFLFIFCFSFVCIHLFFFLKGISLQLTERLLFQRPPRANPTLAGSSFTQDRNFIIASLRCALCRARSKSLLLPLSSHLHTVIIHFFITFFLQLSWLLNLFLEEYNPERTFIYSKSLSFI